MRAFHDNRDRDYTELTLILLILKEPITRKVVCLSLKSLLQEKSSAFVVCRNVFEFSSTNSVEQSVLVPHVLQLF